MTDQYNPEIIKSKLSMTELKQVEHLSKNMLTLMMLYVILFAFVNMAFVSMSVMILCIGGIAGKIAAVIACIFSVSALLFDVFYVTHQASSVEKMMISMEKGEDYDGNTKLLDYLLWILTFVAAITSVAMVTINAFT